MDVPVTTSIKRNRVGNIDTDRLVARAAFVRHLVTVEARTFERRAEWAARVAELLAIEAELDRRNLT